MRKVHVGDTWEGYRAAGGYWIGEVRQIVDFTDKQVVYRVLFDPEHPYEGCFVETENPDRVCSTKEWRKWAAGATSRR